jgi:glycosyltransferase involved in cell wall biosynthesis
MSLDANSARRIWIVMAAYNESSRLERTIVGLLGRNYSIVVVDDGSRDDTFAVARTLPVWALRHPINCGQGAALQTGIDFALLHDADVIVTFDADGQHDPGDIAAILEPVLSGEVDVTLGSRFLRNDNDGIPRTRRVLLQAAILFTRLTNGLQLTDTHNGFRAFSRDAAKRIRIRQPRMAHASEILDQIAFHKLRYVEVPVTIRYTGETLAKGQTSWDTLRITGQLVAGRFWQ